MVRVVEVLDDLLGLPVTPGAVGILEDRQCAPGDALGKTAPPSGESVTCIEYNRCNEAINSTWC